MVSYGEYTARLILCSPPFPYPGWKGQGLRQSSEKFSAGDFITAKTLEMRISDLTVDHRKVPLCKLLGKSREHHFGRICHALKHRLAKKCCAQTHTVNPARQFVCSPCFYGVSKPCFMQRAIRVDHLFGDPSAFPYGKPCFRAGANDLR